MLNIALLLASFMGLTLGLLGGGGSILTVPLLVYVLGHEPKSAIANSLFIVGLTSLVALIPYAREGQVRCRTGFMFGASTMLGAFFGGHLAAFIPGQILLLLFALLMVVTGIAMLRPRKSKTETTHPKSALQTAALGLAVGSATGLVGAGGGFMVVPALLLLGGLEIRAAIGTSLLVIAMNSFAGLFGHLSHTAIDYALALKIAGAAAIGALLGSMLSKRLRAEQLRRGFAVFVIVVAVAMLLGQFHTLLPNMFAARWPFWVGGTAIGIFVVLFLNSTGQALGVSSGYYDACAAPFDPSARQSWRLPFLFGIIAGGGLAAFLSGSFTLSPAMGMFDTVFTSSLPLKALIFTGGGILLGFGARLGGGCTSGHGIVGMSILSRASIITTITFMIAGFGLTFLLFQIFGGAH